jgi:nucleotide-binding universal stress UspA family protein
MKILVAIDGSDPSLRALTYVLDCTAMFGAAPEITLINVHLPMPSPRARAWVGDEVIEKYYREEADASLATSVALLDSRHRSAKQLRVIGDPGHEVAKAANSGFDLLVIGTKGRSGLSNLLIGSAATRALAESKIPVLLVQ